MTQLKKYKLRDLLIIKNGCDHKALKEGEYPVYGSGGIMRYVDHFLYDKPSILLPRKGSISNIQYCDTPFWTVDTTYYTVVNEKIANPYYLYRYLTLLDLSAIVTGTGLPSMTFDSYYNIDVELPDLDTQRRIASVLSNLDRKIALNRQINTNLEALARQLYDYWFVQFDFPDANGKPYKSSGGKMTYNEKLKRHIPNGWEVKNIFDAIDILYGFPFNADLFTTETTTIPVIRIRDILEGNISTYTTECVNEKYRLHEKDVVIGMDGNFHMGIWHNNDAYLNQRCVRLRANEKTEISAIQILYTTQPYIKYREKTIIGSTVGHLSDKDMKALYIIVPVGNKYFAPRKTMDSITQQIIENKKQISSLTRQRDELLPLLMNGQVTVK